MKGTKTERNLWTAFAGESQARNKYTFYASQAKKDGFVDIAQQISAISDNEKEHSEIWFKLLHGGKMPSTEANLTDCIAGENSEWTDMYQRFAEEADAEGFTDIAKLFRGVADIERRHEEAFQTFLNQITQKRVFADSEETVWVCLNCGHVHVGKEPPMECPVCSHARSYFTRQK